MRLTATRKASSPARPAVGERRHLVAQVAFQLLDVRPVNRPPAAQVHPPLRDLLLERRAVGEGRHAVRAFIQMPRSVSSTTCHCWRWAASCARPVLGDAVVLAPAAALGRAPLRRDEPLPLEPVQHRVEHAVGPLQVAAATARSPA